MSLYLLSVSGFWALKKKFTLRVWDSWRLTRELPCRADEDATRIITIIKPAAGLLTNPRPAGTIIEQLVEEVRIPKGHSRPAFSCP